MAIHSARPTRLIEVVMTRKMAIHGLFDGNTLGSSDRSTNSSSDGKTLARPIAIHTTLG
jgi:hypothetical protein